jgi:peptidoglycan/xylan/chitin deacetylase (PgdA/CDA1 family)
MYKSTKKIMKDKYNKLFGYIGTIFMLHRVQDVCENRLFSNENMKISPEKLEIKIQELIKNNFTFISIDELYFNLQNNIKTTNCIVFTLDDGYLDNYTNALPIFKKYNIPFTIYITTSFPDYNFTMWWYALEDIILNANSHIVYKSKKFDCSTQQQKQETFLQIRNTLVKSRFPSQVFLNEFDKFVKDINLTDYNKLVMDWDILKDISKEKLVTIGSHTISHPSFNFLNTEELSFEINQSRILLENKLGIKVEHFAYPFGSKIEVSHRIIKKLKDFNYKTCVTTRMNNIYTKHSTKLHGLPRVMLTNEFDIQRINNFNFLRYLRN